MNKLGLFLFGLIFISCTKLGKNITVKGRVLNPITGEGIGGVELWLQKTSGGLPGGYKTIKTTTTDENGAFEISKLGLNGYYLTPGDLGDRYPIGWFKENGEMAEGTKFLLNVRKRKTMHVEFHAVEYGNLLINVENQNCEGPADEMKFQFKTQFDDDFGYFTPVFTGCFSVFPTEGTKTPMGQRIYKLTVTRSSGISYIYDTVFVNNTGTTTVNLFY